MSEELEPMDNDEESDEDPLFDNLVKNSTLSPDCVVHLSSILPTEEAQKLGNLVMGIIQVFGNKFHLELLDEVTIADDYEGALAKVSAERGYSGKTIQPTRSDIAHGVAMSLTQQRNGKTRSHIVFSTHALVGLIKCERDTPECKNAFYNVVHELAHVDEVAQLEEAHPGIHATPYKVGKPLLKPLAQSVWSEYYACRNTATIEGEFQLGYYEDTFCKCLSEVVRRGDKYTLARHRDGMSIDDMLAGLNTEYGALMKYAAYLIGHCDGMKKPIEEVTSKTIPSLNGSFFAPMFQRLQDELRKMWDDPDKWKNGIEHYNPICPIYEDLLEHGGITFSQLPDGGWWVSVPLPIRAMFDFNINF